MPAPANIINHIVLALDASLSMSHLRSELVKVADNQIAHLAQRSQELDQETRVTVYAFGTIGYATPRIDCLIYDKDVLRMPSIADLYEIGGNTPLIDATLVALEDLEMTPQKHGEHSFLVYVLTDGQENMSKHGGEHLRAKLARLPDNWTVATFVPDQYSVHEAKKFGFPRDAIAVWDTDVQGVAEVGLRIREVTETFMQARAHARKTGTTFRGTRSLFSLAAPSAAEIKTNLTPMPKAGYRIIYVDHTSRIDDFVESHTRSKYKIGSAYYQLSKREEIQPQKQVALRNTKSGTVYVGAQARALLGLPDEHVKVSPIDHPDYDIFVQSTSVNRKLVPDTKLLLIG